MRKIPIHNHEVIDKNICATNGMRWCCFHSCEQEGSYPAPKPRPHPARERYWFCLEHVRRYNASWNYFSGMSDSEMEHYQRAALAGHRPTWKMGVPPAQAAENILQQLFSMRDGEPFQPKPPPIPQTEQDALALLNLPYPVTLKEIKQCYKKLAKRYHPDVNHNDTQAQEKFIAITHAYNCLIRSAYFIP